MDKTAYKKLLIRMIGEIESEKFLKQLYTIIDRHIRKAGVRQIREEAKAV